MADRLNMVLLIDDDDIDNFAHRRLLEKSNLVEEVMVFEYATDALEHLRRSDSAIELIILDVNLPRMNGFEFLHEFDRVATRANSQTKVLMLSTSENPQDIKRAMDHPRVLEYGCKPLTLEKIQSTVAKL